MPLKKLDFKPGVNRERTRYSNQLFKGGTTFTRIDKAFTWENPLTAHGLMHMVINNAWKGDPYKIDVLFMYMANMAWNSSMNTKETIAKLTDKDEKTGNYKIP